MSNFVRPKATNEKITTRRIGNLILCQIQKSQRKGVKPLGENFFQGSFTSSILQCCFEIQQNRTKPVTFLNNLTSRPEILKQCTAWQLDVRRMISDVSELLLMELLFLVVCQFQYHVAISLLFSIIPLLIRGLFSWQTRLSWSGCFSIFNSL